MKEYLVYVEVEVFADADSEEEAKVMALEELNIDPKQHAVTLEVEDMEHRGN